MRPIQNVQLAELGERICILGPSNSGKSTLAQAIARKRRLAVVHLDLLYHLPDTDWEVRPTDEFVALHNAAITGERWVIDGNYSMCMPQRFLRATGLILLDVSIPVSLFRQKSCARCQYKIKPGAKFNEYVRYRAIIDSTLLPAAPMAPRNDTPSYRPPPVSLDAIVCGAFTSSNTAPSPYAPPASVVL
jgi:hypothetical protein